MTGVEAHPDAAAGHPLTILPVTGLPEITAGQDLAVLLTGAVDLADGDVVVVSQKIVSKAEGAVVPAPPDVPLEQARTQLAREHANRVVADTAGVLIVRTAHGFVCANAGIDASNAAPGRLVLLPEDPDASAGRIRRGIADIAGIDVAVVVTDTFGRAWRTGQTDVAIGVAGIACIRDERTGVDRAGRPLEVTEIAVVDEVSAAADLARRKADGVPAVIVRGLDWDRDEDAAATQLVRTPAADLFPRGRGMLAAALADPEALRPLASADLQRAYDSVSTVAGDVRFATESTGDTLVLQPLPGPAPHGAADQIAGVLGAAAALLYAVLVDAGHAARLVMSPEPAVIVSGADMAPTGPSRMRPGTTRPPGNGPGPGTT